MEYTFGELLGSGAGSDVYAYGDDKVCKLYKQGVDSAEYEYKITLDAYQKGLPAPKVYEIIEHNGRFGIIMERMKGMSWMSIMLENITSCNLKGMSNQEIFYSAANIDLIKNTAKIIYNLHQKKCDLIETAKGSLTAACKYNAYLNDEEKNMIYARIEALPDGDSVCHGDPNPGNFISQNEKVYIIDWNNCVTGHAMYDIAEYILMMQYADVSIQLPKHIMHFISECKNDFGKVFLDEYIKLSHMDLTGMEMWFVPLLVSKMGGNNSPEKQSRLLKDIRQRLFEA